jgi:hypothetical protein
MDDRRLAKARAQNPAYRPAHPSYVPMTCGRARLSVRRGKGTALNDNHFGPQSDNLARSHDDARQRCIQELNSEHPDYQAAQVYATLSVEEALRDMADRISNALRRLG